jgi:hypothetical protein
VSAARETVYQALLDLLTTTGDFKLVSRRNRAPESITPDLSPALFLFERGETYHVVSPSVPPKRCLEVLAIFYNDVGADLNGVPTALINAALDNLDAALKPDPATGRTTLGGLVYSCRANGAVEKAPGDREGKALAVVPLEIILP